MPRREREFTKKGKTKRSFFLSLFPRLAGRGLKTEYLKVHAENRLITHVSIYVKDATPLHLISKFGTRRLENSQDSKIERPTQEFIIVH